MYHKIYKSFIYGLIASLLVVINACDEEEITTNDIQSQLVRSEIDPLDRTTVEAGSEYTITGSNLDIVTSATLAGTNVEVLSQSESSLTFQVPKIFPIGPVSVTNRYRQVSTTEETLAPIYPEITIASWPSQFQVGQPITITGENVHLINQVTLTVTDVNTDYHPASLIGTTYDIAVSGSSSDGSSVDVPTRNLSIPFGATVTGTAEGYSNITQNANSPEMLATAPSEFFEPEGPILLWDFENWDAPQLTNVENDPTIELNGGTGISPAVGDQYLTVRKSGTVGWTNFAVLQIAEPIDVTHFNDPHISFLVNSAESNGGYFELVDNQGNWYHFAEGDDDYKFVTNGEWEWRSYSLTENNAGQDLDLANFQVRLNFGSGNVGNNDTPENYEINIDQIMITDGPVNVHEVVWDFESNVNFIDAGAGASSSVITNDDNAIVGEGYLEVTGSPSGQWAWFGEIAIDEPIDIGAVERPYLNFWYNTGSNYGNIQVFVTQTGGEVLQWNPFESEDNDLGGHSINTAGEWRFISVPMENAFPGFTPGQAIESLRFGYSSGNIGSGTFEFDLDQITISEGPMFYYPNEEEGE